jgi:hypothetical protein
VSLVTLVIAVSQAIVQCQATPATPVKVVIRVPPDIVVIVAPVRLATQAIVVPVRPATPATAVLVPPVIQDIAV